MVLLSIFRCRQDVSDMQDGHILRLLSCPIQHQGRIVCSGLVFLLLLPCLNLHISQICSPAFAVVVSVRPNGSGRKLSVRNLMLLAYTVSCSGLELS